MVRLISEMIQLREPASPPEAPARGNPVGPEGRRGSVESTVFTSVGDTPGALAAPTTVEPGAGVAARGVLAPTVVVGAGVPGVVETAGGEAVALTETVAVGVRVRVEMDVAVGVGVGVPVDVGVAVGVGVCGTVVTQPLWLVVGRA